MIRSAVFNEEHSKRYSLTRDWSTTKPAKTVNLIGLNPSKAGAEKDDPTIRKGIGFVSRWGYNRLVMTNLIPIISTDPWGLPLWSGIDQENLKHLAAGLIESDLIVAAWGAVPNGIKRNVAFPEHLHTLRGLIGESGRQLHCICQSGDGSPRHPSRVAYTFAPIIYAGLD